MKKLVTTIIIICVMFNFGMAYAYTVDDPSIINVLEDDQVYVNGTIRNDLSSIKYIGNGYLVTKIDENNQRSRCFTEDFSQLIDVPSCYNDSANLDPYSRAGNMDEIIWADGVYLARSNVYDVPPTSGRVLEKNGYLYILDTDFQLLKRIEFDWYVREMSYIDGVYYVCINNQSFLRANQWGATQDDVVNKVYSSTDLEGWEECADENGRIGNQIVYEEVKVKASYSYDKLERQVLNVAGDYFLIVDNESGDGNWFTHDGIYMTKYSFETFDIKKVGDTLYNRLRDSYAYIKKSDIDRYLRTGDVYVRCNDKILGFETPPVMENDRTLVPMRFLFEQLGADVQWEEATQTATATLANKAVAFSIDENDASVNSQTVTMDVPARLINDKTMVPLRFLSENLGYTVTWDEATNTAIIE